jgi:hypothetical protein
MAETNASDAAWDRWFDNLQKHQAAAHDTNPKETTMTDTIRDSISKFVTKPIDAGRLTADVGDYVEIVIPAQYPNLPDRVIRVIHNSHRIFVTFDDIDATEVGNNFKACLESSRAMTDVNAVELA